MKQITQQKRFNQIEEEENPLKIALENQVNLMNWRQSINWTHKVLRTPHLKQLPARRANK